MLSIFILIFQVSQPTPVKNNDEKANVLTQRINDLIVEVIFIWFIDLELACTTCNLSDLICKILEEYIRCYYVLNYFSKQVHHMSGGVYTRGQYDKFSCQNMACSPFKVVQAWCKTNGKPL